MKNVCVLGSTGYIGSNALRVIRHNSEMYNVVSLGAGKNINLLLSQISEFRPQVAAVIDSDRAMELKRRLNNSINTEILWGDEGYVEIVSRSNVDIVIAAMSGFSGLLPLSSAIASCKDIALANKEALVIAGSLLMSEAKKKGVTIFPIDSEHSAIQQSMRGHKREDLKKIMLTGSGGPFKDFSMERLAEVTPEEALRHPNWQMGKKITIDSATMMNKGMEAIEAGWLFDVDIECIEILIHPQSIIHSMVEYMDGSVIAQLSQPDMRIPIAYALSYPRHLKNELPTLNLIDLGNLSFEKPDPKRFKCLDLALTADKIGGSMLSVMNGANEIAVNAFLQRKIGFLQIPQLIEKTMEKHEPFPIGSIDNVIDANQWAQVNALEILATMEMRLNKF